MRATHYISEKTLGALPPFFPVEKGTKVKRLLAKELNEKNIRELRKALVELNYELWPYRQAWREFLRVAEEKMAEHFLLPIMPLAIRERYARHHFCGMLFSDLHSGRAAEYFSADERGAITPVIFEFKNRVESYARQQILTVAKKDYLARVKSYAHTLKNLRREINRLEKMADKESEHPIIAGEIQAKIVAFEDGLTLLGPELRESDIFNAVDFFTERKIHLNRMRGVHTATQFDFFS